MRRRFPLHVYEEMKFNVNELSCEAVGNHQLLLLASTLLSLLQSYGAGEGIEEKERVLGLSEA